MNLPSEEITVPEKRTPAGLKWTLLVLLFVSAVAGFIFTGLTIHHSASRFSQVMNQIPVPEIKMADIAPVFEKTTPGRSTELILCQGVVLSSDRQAKAIINGQTAEPGMVVSGAKILEVTTSDVFIECNGNTRRLAPGESFDPRRE